MWTLDELVAELKRIRKLGFVKTTHPHQGGVGNTIEFFLGLKENNLRTADLGTVELKAKRAGSTSMLTLASRAPLPRGVNRELFEAYKRLGKDGIWRLYTTIYGSRKNTRGFRIDVDETKLVLENPLNIKAFWPVEKLDDILKKGAQKIVLVWADSKGRVGSKDEKFHYKEAYLLSGVNLKNLKKALEKDKLKVDIRIGADKAGKAAGKYHDHGTGFRISKKDYLHLFDMHQRLM